MLKRLVTITIAFFIGIITLVSCSDNATKSTEQNPPAIPPEHSMAMELSNFNEQSKVQSATTQAKNNFGQAVFRAGLLKTIVDINLAIPTAFLKAASESDARLNENEEWEWKYNTTAESNEYGVRLTAVRDESGSASWNFYVTNPQFNLDNKLFFSGVSDAQGTEGSWSYYSLLDSDGKEEKVSQIAWTVESKDDLNLRLDVVSDRNDNRGDYIDYTLEGTTKAVVHFDASENQETTLQWNTGTNAGSITAPNYNNGNKACWDGNLEDISCPE